MVFHVSFGPIPRRKHIPLTWAAYPFDSPSRWEVKKWLVHFWGDELWLLCYFWDDELWWTPHNGNPAIFAKPPGPPWMLICWQLGVYFFRNSRIRWQICRAFHLDFDARQDCGFSGQSMSFGWGKCSLVGLEGAGRWNDGNRKKWTKLFEVDVPVYYIHKYIYIYIWLYRSNLPDGRGSR